MTPPLPILVVSTESVPGRQATQSLGVVTGSIVQSKHIGRDIMAGLKTLIGGEIKGYTEMLVEARAQATQRMLNEARQLGADAVVNLRYTTSSVMQGMAEIVAYGTAVKLG